MGNFKQNYWLSLITWLVIGIVSLFALPNISQVVAEHGQTQIPSSAKSEVAKTIQQDWGHHLKNTRQIVVVFNNGDRQLSGQQQKKITQTIHKLKADKGKYGIKKFTTAADNSATQKQLVSKDKSTQLLQLDVSKKQSVRESTRNLKKAATTAGVKTYVTGGDVLNDDFSRATEEGIKKTEAIAVIFILLVLIVIFRSAITPLISLLSVGLSFIVSLAIVMNLAENGWLTISNFTQVFMVVVMFGIGTDYNILLYHQFKNDLSQGLEKHEATKHSLKVAGKTILYSGSSVLIGFLTLALAKFSIYRSALGVGIGVAVLLLVLLTLNPFFMATLGEKVFWPNHQQVETKTNHLWNFLSKNSVSHPFIALGIVFLVSVPFVFTYQNGLNYDTTIELPENYSSRQGFKVVQQHFSQGTVEPTTIYIQSNHKLNNEKDLKNLDQITRQIKDQSGIKTVASVTRPSGTKINQLYVQDQLRNLNGQTGKAQSGLSEISRQTETSSFDSSQLKDIGNKAQLIGQKLKEIQSTSQSNSSQQNILPQLQQKMTAAGQPLSAQQLQLLGVMLQQMQGQQKVTLNKLQQSLQDIAAYTQVIGQDAQGTGQQLKEQQAHINQASKGLAQINGGMTSMSQYLQGLQNSAAGATFYIPQNVLQSSTFKSAQDNYLSADKKTAKFTVILSSDPAAKKSLDKVNALQAQVKNNLQGTSLKGARVAVGGQSASLDDTARVSKADFIRSATLMLVGIGIALMLVTRSILQPLYIIGTLLLSYFGGISIARWLSGVFLDEKMLSWNTPFFTFVMLIALGVDYSIFLMSKYREYGAWNDVPSRRIVKASGMVGTVVISAALILGGTFAALIPANVVTLTQVAIGVMSGLLILVFAIPTINSSLIRLTYPLDDKMKQEKKK